MLAFDCACSGLSVAVLRAGRIAAARSAGMATGQAAALAPEIQAVLAEAGIAPAALELIGVTAGPGSFTGIRIGLAMARGLALALDVPLAACSTFDAVLARLTSQVRGDLDGGGVRIVLAIDSKRDEIFIAGVDADGATGAHVAAPAREIESLPAGRYALLGDGAPLMRAAFAAAGREGEIVMVDSRPPQADEFAALLASPGVAYWRESNLRDGVARPLYLRGADVTLPRGPSAQ